MNLSRTVSILFVIRIGNVILRLAGLVLFIRLLGTTAFGSFILFLGVHGLLVVVVDFGLNGAVEKRLSGDASTNVLATAAGLKLALIVPVLLAVIALETPANSYLGADLAVILIPAVLAHQFGRLTIHGLRGELRVAEAAVVAFIRRVVFISIGLIFVAFDWGVVGLVAAYVGGWTVTAVVGGIRISTPLGRPTKTAARSLLDFSKYNFVASVIGSSIYQWLDVLVIGLYLTTTHVAAYEAAWRIAAALVLLSQSIAVTLFPQVSDWQARDALESVSQVFPDAVAGALVLVLPAMVGAPFVAAELLRTVDPGVKIAATALILLTLGKVPEAVNGIVGRVLLGLNRPDLVARAAIVFIVTNLVLNLLLVPFAGLAGAAVATSLAFLVNASLNARYLSQFIAAQFVSKALQEFVVASILMGGILAVLTRYRPVDGTVELFVTIVTGVVTYALILFLLPESRESLFRLIDTISK